MANNNWTGTWSVSSSTSASTYVFPVPVGAKPKNLAIVVFDGDGLDRRRVSLVARYVDCLNEARRIRYRAAYDRWVYGVGGGAMERVYEAEADACDGHAARALDAARTLVPSVEARVYEEGG